MNNLLSQKWYLCMNVQNRIKLCRAKIHNFGDDTTVCHNDVTQRTVTCYNKVTLNVL